MIRFLCLNVFITIHTICFSLLAILIAVLGREGRLVHFYSAVPWAKVILWICGVRVKVEGLENVKSGVPRIYMTNHQSYFDIFVLLACLPVDFKFILKQELMRIPFLGSAMKGAGYIAIDRADPRKAIKSMNEAAEKIHGGVSVLIFPEGTRSEDGRLQPFKKGGFHLAIKSGCDVVPVVIVGSHRIVPKGSLKINRGTIAMTVCEAIPAKGFSKRDMDRLMTMVRESMMGKLRV
jgi:1-acyl-sn-glycerol-3-phosphate acyltransferase